MKLSSLTYLLDDSDIRNDLKIIKEASKKLEEASRDNPVSSPSRSSVPSSSKDGNSQNMKSTSKPDGYGVSKQSSGNNRKKNERLKGVLLNINSIPSNVLY